MMLPALTAWPPNSFTPRRLLSESRPLRVEPPAFLCAMSQILLKESGLDASDLDFGEPLTVALTLHVVLAATELDDGDLVVAALTDHFSSDLGAFDDRSADLDVVAVADQQHAVKIDGFAGGDFQLLDLQEFTFGDLVLFATGNDYSVHGCSPLILLTQRLIGIGMGWHGCAASEGSPSICVRQGNCPGKFRVRDCTQGAGGAQAARGLALTVRGGAP